jgi:hypothetical protein
LLLLLLLRRLLFCRILLALYRRQGAWDQRGVAGMSLIGFRERRELRMGGRRGWEDFIVKV